MILTASGTISTNTDTPLIPALANPLQRVYILIANAVTTIAGTTSSAILKDGASGKALASGVTTAVGGGINGVYSMDDNADGGLPLTPGQRPTITTAGAGAATIDYFIKYRIRGPQ